MGRRTKKLLKMASLKDGPYDTFKVVVYFNLYFKTCFLQQLAFFIAKLAC